MIPILSTCGRRVRAAVAALALVVPAVAQGQPMVSAASVTGPIDLPELVVLRGEPLTIRYTLGMLDRTAHVQQRLEPLSAVLASWTPEGLEPGAYVLGPLDWKRALGDRPSHRPLLVGGTWIALPAMGDDASITFWRDEVGILPDLGGQPNLGTPEQSAALAMGDILAGPTLVIAWMEATGRRPPEPAAAVFFAHLITAAIAGGVGHVELPVIDTAWDLLANAPARGESGSAVEDMRVAARLRLVARRLIAAHGDLKIRRWLDHRARAGLSFDLVALADRFPEVAFLIRAVPPTAPR